MTELARALIDLAGGPIPALHAAALSIGAGVLLIEAIVSALGRRRLLDLRDVAANLGLFLGYLVIAAIYARFALGLYVWVSDHALVRFTTGGWHVGQGGLWWEWLVVFVLEDLAFYAFHRASHRVGILWASHVTHHSSRWFNLSVALRQTWMPFTGVIFWLPLLLVGLDPLMVLTAQALSLTYQELQHTRLCPRLGPLEWLLNTPRHHAVHHGSNTPYLDRNFGGVLIVWDRLFGTFAPESEPIRFGLTHDVGSANPIVLAFHEWAALVRDVARAPRHAVRRILGPPLASDRPSP